MTAPAPKPPICPTCPGRPARLTTGAEIYPHRDDLHGKHMWVCDGCNGYVGCHGNTTRALGTPAHAALRFARMKLHEMVDPLWEEAHRTGLYKPEDDNALQAIRNAARGRVYGYLAEKMGIGRKQTHIAMFDLEQCRTAWRILRGVSYSQIREWAKARREAPTDTLAAGAPS